ncbi:MULTISPECIES: acetylornithine transaminase [unclassified Cryobacterium]|uniref:acetylornithine transaminase n=1 Tax=unclassified Cryobacterium TaxID=2649013 RepID=UPI002AB40F9E|nr:MULTISPECIES: acetylornithine transaminase [unclassified Cryobacterium]MDY7543333.1 acetylornithine transaminase [Cryobacterium sp. 5B3]MEB0000867.1 acetylornithine transaminase [Cryobacterium sp. RTS3]MEB0265085.1 acetylornithine transaminase [Cryobacterium sp. 10I5]MEB0276485.1 acetylornithine transaminase [Cryobacterium sp. 5B3]
MTGKTTTDSPATHAGTTDAATLATRSEGWRDRYTAAMMLTFAPPRAMLVRGAGCYVWDENGTEYLDFLAGIAVNSIGHAHPEMVAAVSAQVGTLAHISNYFASPSQIELAERLKRITGAGQAGRVYFCNSGAEANEAAFKLARLNIGSDPARPRTRILSLHESFHGRTMGALALSGKPAMRAPFLPVPGGVEHIHATFEALEAAIDDTVAALFLEPVQGEAGVIDLPDGFLRRARELCTRHGVLLILDEVQTGAGRTGDWFAYQHDGILPDAISIAKGIGGGVPIGALVTFGATSELFQRGQHGSTFGGNPLATTTANTVLGIIERDGLVANAARRGEQLRDLILGFDSPHILEVRGRGLLLGIGLAEPVALKLADAALEAGLIINAANESTIRLAPPLIVGDTELAEFGRRFGLALASL